MIGSSKRSWLLWGVLLFAIIIIFAPSLRAQYTVDVYIGNVDGSPFHVPNQGVVDLPVWITGPRVGGGEIGLNTLNEIIPERLGGNFHLDGQNGFSTPESYGDWTRQILTFVPYEWRDGIFHLADFTVRIDVDSSRIGDIVDALQIAPARFTDTLGEYLYNVSDHVSQLAIDGVTVAGEPDGKPMVFRLHPAYPNPFNASTTISFTIVVSGDVELSIYDITGRKVRSFEMPSPSPGEKSIVWKGDDDKGVPVASGIYFYRIECGNNLVMAHVTLLK
jgi:hypothetical protein